MPGLSRTLLIFVLAFLLPAFALLGGAGPGAPSAAAQGGGAGWRLYGHDNGIFGIIRIDTATGRATAVGPTGFSSGAAAMAAAGGPVPGPGGVQYPAGTFFGLLGDNGDGRDYVTVSDPVTGRTTKLVATSRTVGGRGIAFGPDGVTLYLIESTGELSIVDTVSGQLRSIGTVRDASGTTYGATSLELDPDSRTFLAIGRGSSGRDDTVIQISPSTGRAVPLGRAAGISACTLVRAPAAIAGPGGVDLPAGSWLTVNLLDGTLVVLDVDVAARTAGLQQVIGPLGPESSGTICGAAFAAPIAPPTEVIPPTRTPVPTEAAPGCICREVRAQVPPAIIADALANPLHYYGWGLRLDQGKPPGPANPLRECLTLVDRNIAYHPLWNSPIWRVGCP
jgi:hypothetical protein